MTKQYSLAELLRRARRQGCTAQVSRGGHYRIDTPRGPVFTASTPSDHRALRNIAAELRRKGVDIRQEAA